MFSKISFLLFFICSFSFAGWKVGTAKVTTIEGQANKLSKKGALKSLKIGTIIKVGEGIQTKAKSTVEVSFVDGTKMLLKEKTKWKLEKYSLDKKKDKTRQVESFLEKGALLFDVVNLLGDSSYFQMKTHTATASIRGTRGGMEASSKSKKKDLFYLEEGKMDLLDPKGKLVKKFSGNELIYSKGGKFFKEEFKNTESFQKGLQDARKKLGLEDLFFKSEHFKSFSPSELQKKAETIQSQKSDQLKKSLKGSSTKKLKSLF